jgi:uncharacterized membrane protein YraQ (UPF0718 family)
MKMKLNSINTSPIKNSSSDMAYEICSETKRKKTPGHLDIMAIIFFVLTFLYIIASVIRSMDPTVLASVLTQLRIFNTVFWGILIQAIPFVLLGVFISSVLQMFLSSETICNLFPHNTVLGMMMAVIAGVFFPLCDCAVVPVASRLVKKGLPLPTAITFMLAAPIVNPIVIASTLYAFPGQPLIACYRVVLGVIIALAVGLAFTLFPGKSSVLLDYPDDQPCSCGCNESYYHHPNDSCCEFFQPPSTIGDRIAEVFHHASEEFFLVGRYLILGALICSGVQLFVPASLFNNLPGGVQALSLLVMMLAAFVLSICSTSDAFIARTFTNQFSMGSVMGFMILGPMIDIKNLLMLTSNFKKSMVIKLVFLIFSISYAIMLLFIAFFF